MFAEAYAFKVALAAIIALLATQFFNMTNEHYFAWYSLFSIMINRMFYPHQSSWHHRMIERFIGVGCACLIAYLLVYTFINWSVLLLVLLAITFLCAYRIGENHRFKYAFVMGMIYLNVTLFTWVINPESFPYALKYLPINIGIAFLALCISDVFFPSDLARKLLPKIKKHLITYTIEKLKVEKLTNLDITEFVYFNTMIENARLQMNKIKFKFWHSYGLYLRKIAVKLDSIRTIDIKTPREQKLLKIFKKLIIKDFMFIEKVTLENIIPNYKPLISSFLSRVEKLKWNLTYNEHVLLYHFQAIAEDLAHIANPDLTIPKKIKIKNKLNKTVLIFAFKMTLVIFLTEFLIVTLNIPGGLETLVAAIVMATFIDVGGGMQRLFQRFLGALSGGILGFVCAIILSFFTSSLLFFLMVFLYYYCSVFIGMNKIKYYYICTQSTLIFIIILFSNGNSIISLSEGLERFLGVISGVFVASIILFLVKPQLPHVKLRENFTDYFKTLQAAFKLPFNQYEKINFKLIIAKLETLTQKHITFNQNQKFMMFSKKDFFQETSLFERITLHVKQLERATEYITPQELKHYYFNIFNRIYLLCLLIYKHPDKNFSKIDLRVIHDIQQQIIRFNQAAYDNDSLIHLSQQSAHAFAKINTILMLFLTDLANFIKSCDDDVMTNGVLQHATA